ncbi:hypothetical protein P692DRAFT_20858956 [Suillus brevipes Sb2]|nr:hypothetical protein P692DRAFT_20858956 [Suillus brevipes Sb2]
MSDCCDIIFGLVTCCCSPICLVRNASLMKMVLTDPASCSKCCSGCKKQDENLENVSPELVQDQPQRREPMIANDARSQQITPNNTSGGGSR